MRHISLTLFAIVAAVALLAACFGGGEEPPEESGVAGATSTVEADPTAVSTTAPPESETRPPAPRAVPSDLQTATVDERPSVMDVVDRPPPIASLITVGAPAPGGKTTVSGAPGAVPPRAFVVVASLAYSAPAFVRANRDGSFETETPTAPGDTIQIRYQVEEVSGTSVPGELAGISHWPGTLVRVPQSQPGSGFAGALYRNVEGGILRGFVSGAVSETLLAVGESTRVDLPPKNRTRHRVRESVQVRVKGERLEQAEALRG